MMEDNLELSPEDAALLVPVLGFQAPTWESGDRVRWAALRKRIEAHAALVPLPLNGDTVWGGSPMWSRSIIDSGKTHNQPRTIVRARSKAEAMRMLESSGTRATPSSFRDYWGETGNRRELALATERGVWAEGAEGWVKLWPK